MPKHTTIDDRTATHPCYDGEAHQKYARLHLAVAPACNIQCHYCNRKYSCANESRPGVVAEVLTPKQALARVAAVKVRFPQLTVVGIAGPGDALANPDRLITTCSLIRDAFPELMLCLSTNGLALPAQAARLVDLGVHHVTVTINALDPTVTARIHPWIFWEHRRRRGLEAARILIDNQLAGLDILVAKGVAVKINSVLIPGVNDTHLPELNEVISRRGARIHNIVPLLSDPSFGTYHGLMGQRGPTPSEVAAVRRACRGTAIQMTHCRQCRADAVGLLGADHHAEFSTRHPPAERCDGMGHLTVPPTFSTTATMLFHAAGTLPARSTPGPFAVAGGEPRVLSPSSL
ncbi:MAG: nitrogenase cofactor biosynthesis protein NifB [Magnetococcales bacterium]|nr:nitrogenase cofactor biosynthesis protein NifB [Magnetococcales bacterium]